MSREELLQEWIEKQVAKAPPIVGERRERLRALLRPDVAQVAPIQKPVRRCITRRPVIDQPPEAA